jgi:hypothetical protein
MTSEPEELHLTTEDASETLKADVVTSCGKANAIKTYLFSGENGNLKWEKQV